MAEIEDGFALGANAIPQINRAACSGSVGYDGIHDDVVTFDRDLVEHLEGKAKPEFKGVGGASGKQTIEESSTAAKAMTVA